MKWLIIFFLLFGTAQAQTLTTAKLSTAMRRDSARIDALIYKAKVKDASDDRRNFLIDSIFKRVELLFWQSEGLNQRAKALEKKVDSAGVYPDSLQFNIDSQGVMSFKPDAFMIVPRTQGLAYPSMPYTLTFPQKDQKDQDIADYKWQIEYFEKLLDDDKKIIDKLQKRIKTQQLIIDKQTQLLGH